MESSYSWLFVFSYVCLWLIVGIFMFDWLSEYLLFGLYWYLWHIIMKHLLVASLFVALTISTCNYDCIQSLFIILESTSSLPANLSMSIFSKSCWEDSMRPPLFHLLLLNSLKITETLLVIRTIEQCSLSCLCHQHKMYVSFDEAKTQ